MTTVFFILSLCCLWVVTEAEESYHEELLVKRLPSLHTLVDFRFKTSLRSAFGNHYNLFPKMIGELIQIYDLDELHFSLTQGLWRQMSWGYQPQPPSPAGAQVWAWFNYNATNIEDKWRNLIHALSGLFCASLSQLEPTLTLSPRLSFRPKGTVSEGPQPLENARMRYGVLPSENVCTENLTPWKKLLPCSERGLASLLNPVHLYDSHFHCMSLDVRRVCQAGQEECANPSWEVVQSIISVFDAPILKRSLNWSLKEFFKVPLRAFCPLAKSTDVFVEFGEETKPNFHPPPTETINDSFRGQKLAKFDVKTLLANGKPLDVGATYTEAMAFTKISPVPVSVHSFLGGTGLQDGRLMARIENRQTERQKVLFAQAIPWFLRTYFHTLEVRCKRFGRKKDRVLEPLFTEIQLGKDRKKPYVLELGLELPAASECTLSLDFEKSLLRWTEYPPDAHHGFFVPAAVLSFKTSDLRNATLPVGRSSLVSESLGDPFMRSSVVEVFGEVLLVNLPTPDFSMPYNVICLVCTVVALAFGPIHNMTTRSLVLKDSDELKKVGLKFKVRSVVQKIVQKLKIGKFRRNSTADGAENKTTEQASHEKGE